MLCWLRLLLLLLVTPLAAQPLASMHPPLGEASTPDLAIQLRAVRDSFSTPIVLEANPGHMESFLQDLRARFGPGTDDGLIGRFYAHSSRFAAGTNLARWPVGLPEGSLQGPVMNQWVYNTNTPLMRSIMQSALGQALLEELFSADDEDVNNQAFTVVPPNSQQDFERRVSNPLLFNYGVRLSGAWAGASYNLMGLRLGTGYATETGRMNPVSLSYPFVSEDLFGEIGVDSRGSAWLYLQSSW